MLPFDTDTDTDTEKPYMSVSVFTLSLRNTQHTTRNTTHP
jgi:hypothetical protein